jgi:hypothetical protein
MSDEAADPGRDQDMGIHLDDSLWTSIMGPPGVQAPGENELAACIRKLSRAEARYALDWIACGYNYDRSLVDGGLGAVDRRRARRRRRWLSRRRTVPPRAG